MQTSPAAIRLIVSDLDGVWTDGRIIYTGDSRETKEFNVRDGLAVKLAQRVGIEVAVLTSRSSKAVERRCRELGVTRLVQGAADKTAAIREMLTEGLEATQILYVGDDLPDLGPIGLAGISAAPADAAPEVLARVDWKLTRRGGEGAFRELVERLLRERNEWDAVVGRFDGSDETIPGV